MGRCVSPETGEFAGGSSRAAAGREDAWMGSGGRRPTWPPLGSPRADARVIQKQVLLYRGETFLGEDGCCWGEGAGPAKQGCVSGEAALL